MQGRPEHGSVPADRTTTRQSDRETEKHSDRETERRRDKETERHRDKATERQSDRETSRQRSTDTETQRHKETEILSHKETERRREMKRDRQGGSGVGKASCLHRARAQRCKQNRLPTPPCCCYLYTHLTMVTRLFLFFFAFMCLLKIPLHPSSYRLIRQALIT